MSHARIIQQQHICVSVLYLHITLTLCYPDPVVVQTRETERARVLEENAHRRALWALAGSAPRSAFTSKETFANDDLLRRIDHVTSKINLLLTTINHWEFLRVNIQLLTCLNTIFITRMEEIKSSLEKEGGTFRAVSYDLGFWRTISGQRFALWQQINRTIFPDHHLTNDRSELISENAVVLDAFENTSRSMVYITRILAADDATQQEFAAVLQRELTAAA